MSSVKTSSRLRTTRTVRKTDRLELRVTRAQKLEFQRAADLRGLALSEFVTASVSSAAREAIAEAEVMKLAARDRQVFFAALTDPPAPSAALLKAAARYKQLLDRPGKTRRR